VEHVVAKTSLRRTIVRLIHNPSGTGSVVQARGKYPNAKYANTSGWTYHDRDAADRAYRQEVERWRMMEGN
jgi:hypothetical protein